MNRVTAVATLAALSTACGGPDRPSEAPVAVLEVPPLAKPAKTPEPAVAPKKELVATIKTSLGDIECTLYEDKAPQTVMNFVGLATGQREWKNPKTGKWTKEPAYDGTTFHRVIKGFMIQGGDPAGNGTGEPGFVIPDEIWPGAKHDRAGQLCMANRGKNTNGAQFFITDAGAPYLDGNYTIFGECTPLTVIHAIAATPVSGERPTTPVTIESVRISQQ